MEFYLFLTLSIDGKFIFPARTFLCSMRHILIPSMFSRSSCCLGILAEARAGPERTFKSFFRREPRDQSLRDWKRQWSSSTRDMENDASNYNYLDDHHPLTLTSLTEGMNVAMENANDHSFVNQGLSQNVLEKL